MALLETRRAKATALLSVIALLAVVALGSALLLNRGDEGTRSALQAADRPTPVENRPSATPRRHAQAVVSNHELATAAGIEILNKGGTAADAAVGVAAALSVVEPWFSSALGGGTWALYYDAENQKVTSLDGVGPTGSKATVADFRPKSGSSGMHQAVVPGAWDGWMLWLDRYGKLNLGEVLAPAIRLAREGYPVSEDMDEWLDRGGSTITNRPDVARIYVRDGDRVEAGDTVRQVEMAETFEALAEAYQERRDQGRREAAQAARDYFYRGPIARKIVDFSDANGGYLTIEDFNNFEGAIVDPISVDYRDDLQVFQNPPNSQGITMLMALNIVNGYDFSGAGVNDVDAVHRKVEAMKLAFADRHYHVGDPARVDVPVKQLLSDEHAQRQRTRISPDRAMQWPIEEAPLGEAHTTTFQIVDGEGNAASVTTSLGAQFLVIGDTGIHINNRMRFLAFEEGDPNRLTPGYKVRHTSNPYLVLRNGRPYIIGGNTGVDTQAQGQFQQLVNVVDFGLTPQEAISRPRWVSRSFPATTVPHRAPNDLQVEEGFPEPLIEGLRAKGHDVTVGGGTWGAAHMILINEDGTRVQTGAEPRNGVSSASVVDPEDRSPTPTR